MKAINSVIALNKVFINKRKCLEGATKQSLAN